MNSHVVSELINLAQMSTMTSKHAAAIVSGKRILAMATNYSLPSGDLVDHVQHTKSGRGGKQISATNLSNSSPRVQGSLFNSFHERAEKLQSRERALATFRYEKDGTIKTEDSTNWISAGKTCRGECFAKVSL